MLTSNTDIASANIFTAGVVQNASDRVNALQDEDVLTGTGTNATLNATLGNANDNGGTTVAPVLSNIETINVRFTGAGVSTQANGAVNSLDLQNSTGVKNISVTGISAGAGADAVSFINIGESATNNFSIAAVSVPAAIRFDYQDGVLAGSTDVASIAVRGVTLTELSLNNRAGANTSTEGAETLTLNSVGSANTIEKLNATQLRNLTVTGDRALTLAKLDQEAERLVLGAQAIDNDGAGSFVLQTINASTLTTAGLTIDLTGHTGAQADPNNSGQVFFLNAVGSAQADTFYIGSAVEDSNIRISGGASRDTVKVYNNLTDNLTTPALRSEISAVEALEVRSQGTRTITVDTDLITNLETIVVRNEGAANAGASSITLNNVSVAAAGDIRVNHSTSTNNQLANNTVVTEVRGATAANDVAGLSLVTDLNTQTRFNLNYQVFGELTDADLVTLAAQQTAAARTAFVQARAVESLTIRDTDNESNTIALVQTRDFNGTVQTNLSNTLRIEGGQATQFLNLDATANAYRYDLRGTALDGTAGAPGIRAANDGSAAERLAATTIDSSTYAGSVILRAGLAADGANNGGQSITFGVGNDTVIFDVLGSTNAGFTIADTVNGGAGNDILAFDGQNQRVTIQATEFQNTQNFEIFRFLNNGVAANGANNLGTMFGQNSYNVSLNDQMLSRNGVANANGTKTISIVNDSVSWNDDGVLSNEELIAEVQFKGNLNGVADNQGITIDARLLGSTNGFVYNGEETSQNVTLTAQQSAAILAATGVTINAGTTVGMANRTGTLDRFIFADQNINGTTTINGGAVYSNNLAAFTGNATAAFGQAGAGVTGDVLEVRNAATLGAGDLANISNVNNLLFTNDTITTQVVNVELNNSVVDAMVNSTRAAALNNTETLNIVAADSNLVFGEGSANSGNLVLNVNGGAITSTFLNLNVVGGTGADNITGGAGNDIITAARGADILTGGAGADTFRFAKIDGSAAINGTTGTFTGFDSITDFSGAQNDRVVLNSGSIVLNGAVNVNAIIANINSGAFDANGNIGVAKITTATVTNLDNVADVINAIGAIANETVGESAYFVVDLNGGTRSGVYAFTSTAADGVIGANELVLIGVTTGQVLVANLATENFI